METSAGTRRKGGLTGSLGAGHTGGRVTAGWAEGSTAIRSAQCTSTAPQPGRGAPGFPPPELLSRGHPGAGGRPTGKVSGAAASGARAAPSDALSSTLHPTPPHAGTSHGSTHSEDSISIDIAVSLRVQAPLGTDRVAHRFATPPAAALRHFRSAPVSGRRRKRRGCAVREGQGPACLSKVYLGLESQTAQKVKATAADPGHLSSTLWPGCDCTLTDSRGVSLYSLAVPEPRTCLPGIKGVCHLLPPPP